MTRASDSDPCLIGLDIGTSALKGVLTDASGEVLAEASAENCLLHPQEGWVELDAETHYQNVCRIIRELTADPPGEVAALAMAAASGNTLLADADGCPLTNIISWLDNRAVQQPPEALNGLTSQEVAQVTGWPCVTSFPLAHLAWLQENRPSLCATASHVGMDTDWLVYRLTGLWRMDHSTATTFHLQDQGSGRYHAPFLERIGVGPEKLSRLGPSGKVVGSLTAQASHDTGLSERSLVVTGCFDHPAAARASGVVEEGQLMLSCGTSWVGLLPHADRDVILKAGLLCDPFLSAGGGPWAGMFSVPRIGRAIDWYLAHAIAPDQRDPLGVFNELAAQAEPGAGGLAIDLRQPPRLPRAGRANISRAVMEGAARLVHGQIAALRSHGLQFDRAVMVGGPARSPVWPAIVADITGLELTVGGRLAGARGAAMLAGIGIGLHPERSSVAATDTEARAR